MKKKTYALPSGTHASVIVGLGSMSSPKWRLFLKDEGPYWNYMAKALSKKQICTGRPDLMDEALNITVSKLANCLTRGKFVYTEAGKGHFRAFLKQVATRTALDILRKEKLYVNGEPAEKPLTQREEREVLAPDEPDSRKDERTLDAYDATAGVAQPLPAKRATGKSAGSTSHLVSLEDLRGVFDEDGSLGTKDPVAMAKYEEMCSETECDFLRRVRNSVFQLALVSVLANEKVVLRRRRLLALLYIDHLKPANIYKMEEFAAMKRGAFDQAVWNAREELTQPILALWREVAPENCKDSEEKLKVLWSSLSNSRRMRRIIAALREGRTDGLDLDAAQETV